MRAAADDACGGQSRGSARRALSADAASQVDGVAKAVLGIREDDLLRAAGPQVDGEGTLEIQGARLAGVARKGDDRQDDEVRGGLRLELLDLRVVQLDDVPVDEDERIGEEEGERVVFGRLEPVESL